MGQLSENDGCQKQNNRHRYCGYGNELTTSSPVILTTSAATFDFDAQKNKEKSHRNGGFS
ncbi:hypothetical protein Q4R69_18355 [Morganella morganii subsp. sibonii]|uniref:hypothetical protein n=1 Tax=Morganella morganii TaxID=582 RepID=UPI0031B15A23